MNELVAEIAGSALRLAGASPVLTAAVQRVVPTLIDYARSRILAGGDPAAELELMMRGAEETARLAAHEKFGV